VYCTYVLHHCSILLAILFYINYDLLADPARRCLWQIKCRWIYPFFNSVKYKLDRFSKRLFGLFSSVIKIIKYVLKIMYNHNNYFIFCNQWAMATLYEQKLFVFREPIINSCASTSIKYNILNIGFEVYILGYKISDYLCTKF